MAPYTAGRIGELLKASALGAASSCTGGPYGNTCGVRWYINGFDDKTGLGQQLCATEIFYSLLVNETIPPGTGPSVVIRDAPDNISLSTTPAQPPATATARPLFQNHQGTGTQNLISTFAIAIALLLMVIMI